MKINVPNPYLNIKHFYDQEFTILSVNEGSGKLINKVGNMTFED